MERNITILQEKDEEISGVVNKMEGKEDVNIDDVVVPAAPLYRQWVDTTYTHLVAQYLRNPLTDFLQTFILNKYYSTLFIIGLIWFIWLIPQ